MIDAIIDWLQSGADTAGGMQLIKRAGVPPAALKMLHADPKAFKKYIAYFLIWKYNLDLSLAPSDEEDEAKNENAFRAEFPFLNKTDCPTELQLLATRKITLYHHYVEEHAKLTNCHSLLECAKVANEVVVSFMENRMVWKELNHYKEHGDVLGKHPIFKMFRRRQELLHKSVKYLMKRKKQLENNIWRVKDEMKKGDKPHLAAERMARLNVYEAELAEVNKLLEDE